jgi:uncharacterized membrane protein YhaH (DUF805 family)
MIENIFRLTGRVGRTEYLVCLVFSFFAFVCAVVLSATYDSHSNMQLVVVLLFVLILFFIIVQSAKRCHDFGKNGWWQLIPFYFFVLLFKEGDSGGNAYGTRMRKIDRIFAAAKERPLMPRQINPEVNVNALTESELLALVQAEIEKLKLTDKPQYNEHLAGLLSFAAGDRQKALNFLDNYEKMYKRNLVDMIGYISSDYTRIHDYLYGFISAGILARDYPHRKTAY